MYWPTTPTCGCGPPPVVRRQTENSASGACGAHPCQACTTAAAWDQGQLTRKVVTVPTALSLNWKPVATPKFPPPPPRQAQKRSSCSPAEQTCSVPSAVTSLTWVTLSLVVPSWRDAKPTPPPRVSPATPTVGQEPAGMVIPCSQRPA